ncbi:MAG: small multi-drug export protein [Halobacteria archaeon]
MVLPPELWVLLIAMSPFVESRGAIPIGLALGLPLEQAVALSLVGNLVPVLPLLLFLDSATRFARRFGFLDRIVTRLFAWTRERHGSRRVGTAGLILTAAIPAPFTGAWTGCLVAYLFNLRMRTSVPIIALGVLQEVAVVSLVVLGVLKGFGA